MRNGLEVAIQTTVIPPIRLPCMRN